MKKIVVLLSLIVGVSKCSCDEFILFSCYIDNKTADTIKIIFSEKHPFSNIEPDSLIFLPKSKKIFFELEEVQVSSFFYTSDECSYSGIKNDDIEIYMSSGRKLIKDFCDFKNNWDCIKHKNGDITKTFTINEEDLE